MTLIGWIEALVIFGLIILCVKPLGGYMARVFQGDRTLLSPVLGPLENAIYKMCRIDPAQEMKWYTYLFAVLGFHVVGLAFLYVLLRTQRGCRSIRKGSAIWHPISPGTRPSAS